MVLLIGSSCSIRESSLMRLVPIKSCAIMTIDWASVRTGGELRRVLKGDEFEAVLRRLGIDSALVKTVVDFSAADSRTTSGLLLRGSFDRKQIGTELKNRWSEASLEGHKVYVHAADYVAMPASNTLFAGTREGVLTMFRAADDVKESILASEAFKKINAAPCLEPPTMSKKAFSLRKLTRR